MWFEMKVKWQISLLLRGYMIFVSGLSSETYARDGKGYGET